MRRLVVAAALVIAALGGTRAEAFIPERSLDAFAPRELRARETTAALHVELEIILVAA